MPALDTLAAGASGFLNRLSPRRDFDRVRCPLFLFHARDDSNVPVSKTEAYARMVSQHNPNVRLATP